jgi:hypothetical protein
MRSRHFGYLYKQEGQIRRTRRHRLTVGLWEPTPYARSCIYMRFPDKPATINHLKAPSCGTGTDSTQIRVFTVRHTTPACPYRSVLHLLRPLQILQFTWHR